MNFLSLKVWINILVCTIFSKHNRYIDCFNCSLNKNQCRNTQEPNPNGQDKKYVNKNGKLNKWTKDQTVRKKDRQWYYNKL